MAPPAAPLDRPAAALRARLRPPASPVRQRRTVRTQEPKLCGGRGSLGSHPDGAGPAWCSQWEPALGRRGGVESRALGPERLRQGGGCRQHWGGG